jgi:hypothetical protein
MSRRAFTTRVVLLVALLAGCGMNGYSTENPDPFCKRLLGAGEPKEVSDWLNTEAHTLGEMNHQDSQAMASKVYSAGASHIFAVKIDKYGDKLENTGHLVVELPAVEPGRREVLAWAARIAHEQGFDAYSDVGQQYVYVKLD